MGTQAGGARRKKCQEASGGCGGEKTGGAAASVVGRRRGIRTPAQQPESDAGSGLESLYPDSRAQPPSPGDCDEVLGPDSRRKGGTRGRFTGSSTTETRTPTRHRAKIRSTKSADGRMATEAARFQGRLLDE